jgi:hypothetical protein
MSEGAGVVMLEDLESAQARGARIYAEVLAYGSSNDAHNMIQPDPEAEGVSAMMQRALDSAGVARDDVGYLNAHGTGTPLGDAAETKAIKEVFGDHAYDLAVSSTKSMTGHLLGTARTHVRKNVRLPGAGFGGLPVVVGQAGVVVASSIYFILGPCVLGAKASNRAARLGKEQEEKRVESGRAVGEEAGVPPGIGDGLPLPRLASLLDPDLFHVSPRIDDRWGSAYPFSL